MNVVERFHTHIEKYNDSIKRHDSFTRLYWVP